MSDTITTMGAKFSLSRATLKRIIQLSNMITEKKTVPILQNVLFETDGGDVIISATRVDQWSKFRLHAQSVRTPGSFCIPLISLKKIVDKGKTDFLDFAASSTYQAIEKDVWNCEANEYERKVEDVTEYKVQVGPYTLEGLDVEDYPAMKHPDSETTTIAVDVTPEDVRTIIPAMSTDYERRNYLCGFCITPKSIVATDGHRAQGIEKDYQAKFEVAGYDQMTVPAAMAKLLVNKSVAKLYEGMLLSFAGQGSIFALICDDDFDGFVGSRAINEDGDFDGFPDYHQTMPKNSPNDAILDLEGVRDALDGCDVMRDKAADVIFLALDFLENGDVRARANSGGFGEYKTPIDGKHMVCKDFFENGVHTVGFNVKYMRDALQALAGEDVKIEFGSNTEPMLIREGDYFAMVMPTRL